MLQDFNWTNAFNIFAAQRPLSKVVDNFRRVKLDDAWDDYGFNNQTNLTAHTGQFRGFDKRAILIVLARSRVVFQYFHNQDWTIKKNAEAPDEVVMGETIADMSFINFIVQQTYDDWCTEDLSDPRIIENVEHFLELELNTFNSLSLELAEHYFDMQVGFQ